jgi:hypothetical protein
MISAEAGGPRALTTGQRPELTATGHSIDRLASARRIVPPSRLGTDAPTLTPQRAAIPRLSAFGKVWPNRRVSSITMRDRMPAHSAYLNQVPDECHAGWPDCSTMTLSKCVRKRTDRQINAFRDAPSTNTHCRPVSRVRSGSKDGCGSGAAGSPRTEVNWIALVLQQVFAFLVSSPR